MKKNKITSLKKVKGTRIWFKTTHAIYPSDNVFDSWMTLCECTFDLAGQEAARRLSKELMDLTNTIAEEMIQTAEEFCVDEEDL